MGSRGAQAPALFSAPRRRSSGRCSAPVPARPPFALDRLREIDPDHLLYASTKQGPGGNGPQLLTPLELLDRLAALVPPRRIHRHRYFGVLAPNSPLRTAAHRPRARGDHGSARTRGGARRRTGASSRRPLRRAMLLARIYEVFPLRCTHCGADMRIIAFITDGALPCATSSPTWVSRRHAGHPRTGNNGAAAMPNRPISPSARSPQLVITCPSAASRGFIVALDFLSVIPSRRLKSR